MDLSEYDEHDERHELRLSAAKMFEALTLEELQVTVALGIDILCDHQDGLDDMLALIPDTAWDQVFDAVKCEPRGGV